MELTKKSLLRHCRDMDQYSTPELNEKLYLHQKGIAKIENLDEYTGVKVLWLQTNGIDTIENLNHMTELRHLYLNENMDRATILHLQEYPPNRFVMYFRELSMYVFDYHR